jgi:hypothetical protein
MILPFRLDPESFMRRCRNLLVLMVIGAFQMPAFAQQEEILLALRHPSIGTVYVNSIFDPAGDKTFLPAVEIFNLLEVNCVVQAGGPEAKGIFLSNGLPYSINLQSRRIVLGKEVFEISMDDCRLAPSDIYLTPEVFSKVFGLNFSVNLNYLILNLETRHSLPVSERKAREKSRTNLSGYNSTASWYPLSYPRNRSLFGGSMIDYQLQGSYAPGEDPRFNYILSGGFELLGGDLQGNLLGSTGSNGERKASFEGARWRYVLGNQDFLRQVSIGQIQGSGLIPTDISGIGISNDPVEPRRMFDLYIVDGTTEPESEVELYINDRISDFRKSDENGYFRFEVPIMYGTTRVAYKIYTRSGNIIESEKQIRIPFSYLPKGVFNYQIQAGQTELLSTDDSLLQSFAVNANAAYGIAKGITAAVGAQHFGKEWNSSDLLAFGSISARIAKQYLLNLDVAPGAFNRLSASVWYPNNLSLSVVYSNYSRSGLFNTRGLSKEMSLNIYMPFKLFGWHSGLRVSGDRVLLSGNSYLRYQGDLSSRIGRVNLRVNFRDNLLSTGGQDYYGEGLLTTSLTYTLGRGQAMPQLLKGWFMRTQVEYDVRNEWLRSSELQLSRTMGRSSRINLVGTYMHQEQSFRLQAGIILDLAAIRSSTNAFMAGNLISIRQTLSGSIGWDIPNKHINLSNRQQVGRAAAGVRLFVDDNSNGVYDQGEQTLQGKALRLNQSSLMKTDSDSILRINQLQSYYQYNAEVNRGALDDPTLVPMIDQFSFIADPNQYKKIEIPFYRGGIAEGQVLIERGGRIEGQGGLRLKLKSDKGFDQVIRSFNDGSFYIMDLPPANYILKVDSSQLLFLNAIQTEPLLFEIRTLPEGEYLEGLNILLKSIEIVTGTDPSAGLIEMVDSSGITGQALIADSTGLAKGEGTTNSHQPTKPLEESRSHPVAGMQIQVGAYRSRVNADNVLLELKRVTNYPCYIVEEDALYKVRIKGLESAEAAAALLKKLEKQGIGGSILINNFREESR